MAHRAGGQIVAVEVDHAPVASAPDRVVAIIKQPVDAVVDEAVADAPRIGRRE